MKKLISALLGLCLLGFAARAGDPPAGLGREESLRLGMRMYRQGVLPSGEPMMAVVQGDIPVDSRIFSCQSCHLRSGLGASEGTIVALPVNWGYLSQPLAWGTPIPRTPEEKVPAGFRGKELRPAYTDETLAEAIRLGLAPPDRQLHPVMPRYTLADRDMAILIEYLKNLSFATDPGVTDQEIHFATVVSDGVPAEDRDAMLAVLEAHVRDHNAQSRWQEQRAVKGPFFDEEMNLSWRRWVLHRWELKGDRSTWPAQLEEYSRKEPVFVLLGGVVSGDWEPVHRFCESHQIPCILPCTDRPVVSGGDWYTLYFSRGFVQEGETVARYLPQLPDIPPGTPVVQVYRPGTDGQRLAEALATARRNIGRFPEPVAVEYTGKIPAVGIWADIARKYPQAILALWLEPADLFEVDALGKLTAGQPRAIFLSSTLMQENWHRVPEALRERVFLTYPYGLPDEMKAKQNALRQWLRIRNIPVTRPAIQARMYFLGWMLAEVFMRMRRNFYRDYFLDLMDMMRDQFFTITLYPRLSFGPGQRFAAKGCYIVQLGAGPEPGLVRMSDWVIY